LQLIYHSIIGGVREILKYHENWDAGAEVVDGVAFWRVTKGMERPELYRPW
jgi:hypothetical protein